MKREILEFDFAEAWRAREVNNKASQLGHHRNLERKITYSESHKRAGSMAINKRRKANVEQELIRKVQMLRNVEMPFFKFIKLGLGLVK